MARPKNVKHIFVTGGVISSLGKGILSASLGMLLKSRGLKVAIQKYEYICFDSELCRRAIAATRCNVFKI